MIPARSQNVLAAGLLIGCVSITPGQRSTAGADETLQAPAASGIPEPAGQSIRRVLRDAARAVQSAPDPSSRCYALVEIIKAQGRAGDKEGALESARQASAAALAMPPGRQSWALVAIVWARSAAGDRDGALNALRLARRHAEEIGTEWGRVQALRMVATAQFDLGEPAAAAETITKLRGIALAIRPSGNNRVGPLSDLVFAETYVGDAEAAFRDVEVVGAGDHFLQGQLYGAMASAAAAESGYYLQPRKSVGEADRRAARRVLDRIVRAVEPIALAEEKPYIELALKYAQLGDFETALRLAHRFGQGTIKFPHTIDLTAEPYLLAAIGGLQGKAGHRAEACATLREAFEMVRRDAQLTAQRLGQVALGQARAGDVAEAIRSLEFLGADQRVSLLTEMAEEREESGDLAGSRAALRRAREEAERCLREPPPPRVPDRAPQGVLKDADGQVVQPIRRDPAVGRRDDLLVQLVKCLAKLGDLPAAVESFRSITGENDRGWAARDIAEARSRAGDVDGALAWAMALEPPSVRTWALRGLATGALAGR